MDESSCNVCVPSGCVTFNKYRWGNESLLYIYNLEIHQENKNVKKAWNSMFSVFKWIKWIFELYIGFGKIPV